ncbi:Lichenan-specific phosphotransferase enzyme IIA component [Neobacillus rhizosphaerae]|uniref:Lichenan-specific phosphotransferase enzyme IIA component n=1 Tax=Neobacillus rhizosphaerae TaxID=2880965 RepID=A0ABM9EUI7_9BACI|nr:PTS lactose/cellobiose transporter subunit IIA [Neobacillus rhizosphaerae]CAH2715872.1 Lichenan-specific phosphotransferase enzyme IIA component [Neobacillus rhizosphaerae]
MSNTNEITEQENELIPVAMQIILYAGDARKLADEAFKLAKEGSSQSANEKMQEAEKEILKAHRSQTQIVQDEARGVTHQPSLLFNHAQDHLMTIMTEIRMTKKMIELYELIVNLK